MLVSRKLIFRGAYIQDFTVFDKDLTSSNFADICDVIFSSIEMTSSLNLAYLLLFTVYPCWSYSG